MQNINSQIIEQVKQVGQVANGDRQEFLSFFVQQQQANRELIYQMQATVEEIKAKNLAAANSLNEQATAIGKQLEQAAQALEHRVANLEQAADKISDLRDLQQGLAQSFSSLEKTAQLEHVLVGVRENLAKLQPILQQLNKPRRIMLVEQDNGRNPK